MPPSQTKIMILGITRSGRPFRPSDWAERLCGILSTFGDDERLSYSPLAQPTYRDGTSCVCVNPALAQISPPAYQYLMDFARDNELRILELGAGEGSLSAARAA